MAMRKLAGKRILIAGGTGDVGVEIVASLLASGADVIALARSHSRAEGLPSHSNLHIVEGFPDTDEALSRLGEMINGQGPIDGAIALLGPWFHGPDIASLAKADWDHMVGASLTSHFMFARLAVARLIAGGRYLMINGGAALGPVPHSGVVSIMARAQTMLADVLAAENPHLQIHTLMLLSIIATRARVNPDPSWVTAHAVGEECVRLLGAESLATSHTTTTLPKRSSNQGSKP